MLEKIQSISIQGESTSDWVVFFQTEDRNNVGVGVNILSNNLEEKAEAEFSDGFKLVLQLLKLPRNEIKFDCKVQRYAVVKMNKNF